MKHMGHIENVKISLVFILFRALGVSWGPPWNALGMSWEVLEGFWKIHGGTFGSKGGYVVALWAPRERAWGPLGALGESR